MKKDIRVKVWNKYDCKCAYCGKDLEYKQMQVDHIVPVYRGTSDEGMQAMKANRGSEDIENYNPSCARCNRWKSTLTVEKFRKEIEKQTARLQRDSSNYRMAIDFGIIKETESKVEFYFEHHDKIQEVINSVKKPSPPESRTVNYAKL